MKQKICKYCQKKLEAYSESQVEYMLKQHILSKHPEKMKIIE